MARSKKDGSKKSSEKTLVQEVAVIATEPETMPALEEIVIPVTAVVREEVAVERKGLSTPTSLALRAG